MRWCPQICRSSAPSGKESCSSSLRCARGWPTPCWSSSTAADRTCSPSHWTASATSCSRTARPESVGTAQSPGLMELLSLIRFRLQILSVTLSALERLAGLLVDPSEKRTCSASALLEVDDATWVQIEDSLASCLNALARPFGQTSLSNHQFLRLASHIVQQEPYHRSGKTLGSPSVQLPNGENLALALRYWNESWCLTFNLNWLLIFSVVGRSDARRGRCTAPVSVVRERGPVSVRRPFVDPIARPFSGNWR